MPQNEESHESLQNSYEQDPTQNIDTYIDQINNLYEQYSTQYTTTHSDRYIINRVNNECLDVLAFAKKYKKLTKPEDQGIVLSLLHLEVNLMTNRCGDKRYYVNDGDKLFNDTKASVTKRPELTKQGKQLLYGLGIPLVILFGVIGALLGACVFPMTLLIVAAVPILPAIYVAFLVIATPLGALLGLGWGAFTGYLIVEHFLGPQLSPCQKEAECIVDKIRNNAHLTGLAFYPDNDTNASLNVQNPREEETMASTPF